MYIYSARAYTCKKFRAMLYKSAFKKGDCKAKYCRKRATSKDTLCARHRHALRKEKDPVSYKFFTLRSNAKRRGKSFDLTLEEFRQFCLDTGYAEGAGKSALSMSIDRIDASKGYSLANMQVLTLSANSTKGNKEDYPF